MNQILIVTFDITGTILRLRKPLGELYAETSKCYGIVADPLRLTKNFKAAWVEYNKSHPNFGLHSIGWEAWWKRIVLSSFEGAYANDNVESKQLIKGEVADDLINTYRTQKGWQLKDGSLELLNYLNDRKVTLGVISNFDPRLYEILYSLEVNHFFKFITTSYEAKCMKPGIEIFRSAENMYETATKLKFDRGAAIHVGDSFNFDYCGAINAGWNAALINEDSSNLNVDPVKGVIFKNLKELTSFFQQMR